MIQHSLLQAISSKTPRIAGGEQGVTPAAAPANGHAPGEDVQGFAAVMLARQGTDSKLPALSASGKILPDDGEGLPVAELIAEPVAGSIAGPVAETNDSQAAVALTSAPLTSPPAVAIAAAPLGQFAAARTPVPNPEAGRAALDKPANTADAAIAKLAVSPAATNAPITGTTPVSPGITATIPGTVSAPASAPANTATVLAAPGPAAVAAVALAAPTAEQAPSQSTSPAAMSQPAASTAANAGPAAPIRTGDLQLQVSKAPALAQAITAEEQPARAKTATRVGLDSLLQASSESAAKLVSAPAAAAPAPIFAQPASPLTAVAAPSAPAPALATPTPQNIETLVERLVQARETALPHSARLTVTNPDFGNVALRFDAGAAGLSVLMTNADPDFAATARMALADRPIAAPDASTRSDLGQNRGDQPGQSGQQQTGQSQSGSSGNGNHAQTLMHNGAGSQQERSGNSAQGHPDRPAADQHISARPAGPATTDTAADTARARSSGLYI